MKKLSIGLALLLLSISAAGWAAGVYDGEWSGTTNQDYGVSFTITEDIVTTFSIQYTLSGNACSVTRTREFYAVAEAIIEDGFTISGSDFDSLTSQFDDYEYTGAFQDTGSATGTWQDESSYCIAFGSGTWTASRSDLIAPLVQATDPVDGALEVPVTGDLEVIFSEEIDPGTITASSFTLSDGMSDIAGSFTINGRRVRFTPTTHLEHETLYTATLTTDIRDLAGNSLEVAYIWSFTTASYGEGWSPMESGVTDNLNGVWGSSSNDLFAVGWHGTILHYDGSSWASMASGTIFSISGVWGTSPNDIFAVGSSGRILHYDGDGWSAMTSNTTDSFGGVWGSSSSDVFAVGGLGTIVHYDGSNWTAMSSGITTSLLDSVWGSSSRDVFAVGGGGRIVHYDGSSWSHMSSGTGQWLHCVWGSSSSDVFAVGGEGTIVHYDGSSWSPMTSGVTSSLYGLWGSSSNDVFAVGTNGTILHYDGVSWSPMTSGVDISLRGVWGGPTGDLFAVGWGGAILQYSHDDSPAVNSTSPADGATDVPVNVSIQIVFSEPMDASTITEETFSIDPGVAATVSYDATTNTATLAPLADLANNTTYTVAISVGATDASGNALASEYSWTFTTGAQGDTSAPACNSVTPSHGATDVPVNVSIQIVFSEPMDASTITEETFSIDPGVAGAVSYDAATNTATLAPLADLAYNTTYTVTVSVGVQDLAGNALPAEHTWSFTTVEADDATAPTIICTSPSDNFTGLPVYWHIGVIFSEPMDAATITAASFRLSDEGGGNIAGSVACSDRTAIFTPASNLAYDTLYTATITTAAKDLAGNPIAADHTWSFRTGSAVGDSLSLPLPGVWAGTADFGEFEFTVDPERTGVEAIKLTWNDYTCGTVTKVSGSQTITRSEAWPIANHQFTIEHESFGSDERMRFDGTIDNVSASAAGDFEVDFYGTICSGDWQAATGVGTVRGVLTLPAEALGKQYLVVIDKDFDGDNGFLTGSYGICNTGTTVNYTIDKVPAGVYCLYAVVYLGNDFRDGPQDGDYLGFYGGTYGTDSFPSEANAVVPSLGTASFDITLGILRKGADSDDGDDGDDGGGGGGGGCFVDCLYECGDGSAATTGGTVRSTTTPRRRGQSPGTITDLVVPLFNAQARTCRRGWVP